MTELNCLFPLFDQPIAPPLSYWCMAVRLGFEPRSQESKSCVLPITLTDYESAPQRHTGTGLLFSSRVLRVLLKRNTPVAIVSDSRSETTNATTHLLRFLWYTAFRSFLPHIKPHRAAPLGRTALASGSLMGKSVLAVFVNYGTQCPTCEQD